jgi:hypothetical protein
MLDGKFSPDITQCFNRKKIAIEFMMGMVLNPVVMEFLLMKLALLLNKGIYLRMAINFKLVANPITR